MKSVVAILSLVLLALPSQATCRKIVNSHHQQQAVVVLEKAAAIAVPVLRLVADVPAYGSYYVPPPPQEDFRRRSGVADEQLIQTINQLTQAVNSLNARVAALEGKPSPAPQPRPGPMGPADPVKPVDPFNPAPQARTGASQAFAQLAGAKCASCHRAGSESQGGGFVILSPAGSIAPEADRKAAKIAAMVYAGKMPPKGHAAVSDEEMAVIMAWLGEVAAK